MTGVTLTVKQLRGALELIDPDNDPENIDSEVTIQWIDAGEFDDGEPRAAGYYASCTEYPEEGVMGPL